MVTLSFKVPSSLVKALDKLAGDMEEEVRKVQPGVNITRTEAIRSILLQAVAPKEKATK